MKGDLVEYFSNSCFIHDFLPHLVRITVCRHSSCHEV